MNNPQTTAAEAVLRRYNDETLSDFCDLLTDVNQVGTFGIDRSISHAIVGT